MEINKYLSAPDQYNNIDEFIREFTNELNKEFEVNWGLDFTYKSKEYHFCRYQMENDKDKMRFSRILNRDVSKCVYVLALMGENRRNQFNISKNTTIIGWFETIEDVLNNRLIDNRSFKDILLDPKTVIT